MKPTVETYTAVLPWYERADFERLWQLAQDHDEMPRDYEVWYASALEVMNASLARGRALQIVTIRPDEFLAWLEAKGLANTAETRLKFVEDKATAAGGATAEVGIAASAGSPSTSDPGIPVQSDRGAPHDEGRSIRQKQFHLRRMPPGGSENDYFALDGIEASRNEREAICASGKLDQSLHLCALR